MSDTDATLMRHNVADDARSLIDDEVHRDCEYYVYSQLRDCIDVIDDDYERLRAENAKLRKFIGLKETCWKYVGWCDECPYSGMDDEHDDCNCTVREKVSSLARELGIEVDA